MQKQYQTLLLNEGINKDRIISINLEELENEEFLDYRILYKHITGRLSDNEMTFITFSLRHEFNLARYSVLSIICFT